MCRINLLRFSDTDWSDVRSRSAARAKMRERDALWRTRLWRWKHQYARLTFVMTVWALMVAGATLVFFSAYGRPVGLVLIAVSNAIIWADTTRRLFADHRNGFFEPRQN